MNQNYSSFSQGVPLKNHPPGSRRQEAKRLPLTQEAAECREVFSPDLRDLSVRVSPESLHAQHGRYVFHSGFLLQLRSGLQHQLQQTLCHFCLWAVQMTVIHQIPVQKKARWACSSFMRRILGSVRFVFCVTILRQNTVRFAQTQRVLCFSVMQKCRTLICSVLCGDFCFFLWPKSETQSIAEERETEREKREMEQKEGERERQEQRERQTERDRERQRETGRDAELDAELCKSNGPQYPQDPQGLLQKKALLTSEGSSQ